MTNTQKHVGAHSTLGREDRHGLKRFAPPSLWKLAALCAAACIAVLLVTPGQAKAEDCASALVAAYNVNTTQGSINCTTAGITLMGFYNSPGQDQDISSFSGTLSGAKNGTFNLTVDTTAANYAVLTGTILGQSVNCTLYFNGSVSGNCGAFTSLFGGGSSGLAGNKTQAAGRQQRIVTQDILSAPLQTSNEIEDQKEQAKQENAKPGAAPRVRLFLADAAVEVDSLAGAHSTIGGVTIGSTIEFDNRFTVGAMIPLDYMSLPGYDAERFGVVGFGQYNWHPSDNKAWTIKPTVFASYIYTAGNGSGPKFGTYGLGTGVSATHDDGGKLIPSVLAFISYNKDDTGVADNYQTLFAIGPRLGFRPSDNWVLDVGVLWNKDVSSYIPSGVKDYYFDLTVDASYRISRTFKLDLGYRKTLGIPQFRSDEFTVGGRFQF